MCAHGPFGSCARTPHRVGPGWGAHVRPRVIASAGAAGFHRDLMCNCAFCSGDACSPPVNFNRSSDRPFGGCSALSACPRPVYQWCLVQSTAGRAMRWAWRAENISRMYGHGASKFEQPSQTPIGGKRETCHTVLLPPNYEQAPVLRLTLMICQMRATPMRFEY